MKCRHLCILRESVRKILHESVRKSEREKRMTKLNMYRA